MTRQRALKIFFEHNRIASRTVDALSKFDSKMSVAQFAVAIGRGLTPAYHLARIYGLKFEGRATNIRIARRKRLEELYASKWDSNKTIGENAEALGISTSTASLVCGTYKLQAKHGHLKEKVVNQIRKMDGLAEKNLNDSEISRVMGVSREWIRQLKILKEAK